MKRKNIKRFTFYIVLCSLFFGACGRKDKEDAERLMGINEQIENLQNEEMNDLAEDISKEKLEEIEVTIELEKEKKLNKENEETFGEMVNVYENIVFMHELEKDVQAFSTAETLEENYFETIEQLSTRLSEIDAEKWTNYVTRQKEELVEVEKAAKSIGEFAGYYYFSEFHELITITENRFEGFTPETGSFFDYEIEEIIHNSDDEITLILYHEERTGGGHPMPEITTEAT